MYGETESPLHQGIGTDRFIVAWPVSDAEVHESLTATHAAGVDRELLESPILNHANDTRASATQTIGERARVEVPTDINSLQQTDHKEAIAWRQSTRSVFRRAMSAGLTVKGFVIDDCAQRGYYLLDRR